MTATTWVQIIKACLLLAGRASWPSWCWLAYGFSPEAMFADAVRLKTEGRPPPAAPPVGGHHRPGDHGPGLLHQGSDLGDLASAWR